MTKVVKCPLKANQSLRIVVEIPVSDSKESRSSILKTLKSLQTIGSGSRTFGDFLLGFQKAYTSSSKSDLFTLGYEVVAGMSPDVRKDAHTAFLTKINALRNRSTGEFTVDPFVALAQAVVHPANEASTIGRTIVIGSPNDEVLIIFERVKPRVVHLILDVNPGLDHAVELFNTAFRCCYEIPRNGRRPTTYSSAPESVRTSLSQPSCERTWTNAFSDRHFTLWSRTGIQTHTGTMLRWLLSLPKLGKCFKDWDHEVFMATGIDGHPLISLLLAALGRKRGIWDPLATTFAEASKKHPFPTPAMVIRPVNIEDNRGYGAVHVGNLSIHTVVRFSYWSHQRSLVTTLRIHGGGHVDDQSYLLGTGALAERCIDFTGVNLTASDLRLPL